MADTPSNTVQSTGGAKISIQVAGVRGGQMNSFSGIKLDETFFSAVQDMDNSKRVALVDGGTAALTNSIRMGKATINVLRTGGTSFASADLAAYCDDWKRANTSDPMALMSVSYPLNKGTITFTFSAVTLVSAPILLLAGNDFPSYAIVISFADYATSFVAQ